MIPKKIILVINLKLSFNYKMSECPICLGQIVPHVNTPFLIFLGFFIEGGFSSPHLMQKDLNSYEKPIF